jgi:hypothetical protein
MRLYDQVTERSGFVDKEWIPDVFIQNLLRQHETAIMSAVALHRAALRNPPKSAEEYLETLLVQGLAETVALLRQYLEKI